MALLAMTWSFTSMEKFGTSQTGSLALPLASRTTVSPVPAVEKITPALMPSPPQLVRRLLFFAPSNAVHKSGSSLCAPNLVPHVSIWLLSLSRLRWTEPAMPAPERLPTRPANPCPQLSAGPFHTPVHRGAGVSGVLHGLRNTFFCDFALVAGFFPRFSRFCHGFLR